MGTPSNNGFSVVFTGKQRSIRSFQLEFFIYLSSFGSLKYVDTNSQMGGGGESVIGLRVVSVGNNKKKVLTGSSFSPMFVRLDLLSTT